jgi:hypothetical protein
MSSLSSWLGTWEYFSTPSDIFCDADLQAKLYQNYVAMRNTEHMIGGKPIAIQSQFISGVNTFNLQSPFTTSMEDR